MSDNGNKPTFDFTRVSRQWNREFARSMTQAARAQLVMQRQPHDEMSDEEIDALLDRQEQAIGDIEALADQQAALLVQVLTHVPAGWLLPGAPDDLDWSQVESLDYIQSERYAEILQLLSTRDLAGENSKNSDTPSRLRQKRRGR